MTTDSPITFVTVCKGRLAHLQRSLPAAAAQAPCVVVDYACPEYAGDWVEANIPQVSIVRAGEPETFHLAAARNAGAAAATSDWLCFIDADVVPSARFVEAITPLLQPGLFYRPWPVTPDTWGTVVCARADFARLGGYDEAFCDWGGEDDDFYFRLRRFGVRQQAFPSHLLHAIEHDDALRMRFYPSTDREVSRRINLVYMMLKNDLRALTGGEADLPIRRAIYAEAQRVLSQSMRAGGQAQLEIDLPDAGLLPEWNARRALRYVIPAPRSLDAPRIHAAARPIVRKETSYPPMPFIVGTGRCGSTLLRLMLDAHPELAIPDETHFIPPLARLARHGASIEQLVESLRPDARWALSGVTAEDLLTRARDRGGAPLPSVLRAFYECYAQRFGKPRYGDKTPPYVNEMPLIRRLFPEARFVHLIRDGRDVALSMRENAWWGPKSFAETAAWWSHTILAARNLGSVGSDYLEVRYEDLVDEPEVTLRRICEFIALEWDAMMLRYYERANERLEELTGFLSESGEFISTERVRGLHTLTREPPNASRIGAWRKKLTAAEIRQFELLAGPLLEDLGYET